jgi:hypothetical protein
VPRHVSQRLDDLEHLRTCRLLLRHLNERSQLERYVVTEEFRVANAPAIRYSALSASNGFTKAKVSAIGRSICGLLTRIS